MKLKQQPQQPSRPVVVIISGEPWSSGGGLSSWDRRITGVIWGKGRDLKKKKVKNHCRLVWTLVVLWVACDPPVLNKWSTVFFFLGLFLINLEISAYFLMFFKAPYQVETFRTLSKNQGIDTWSDSQCNLFAVGIYVIGVFWLNFPALQFLWIVKSCSSSIKSRHQPCLFIFIIITKITKN